MTLTQKIRTSFTHREPHRGEQSAGKDTAGLAPCTALCHTARMQESAKNISRLTRELGETANNHPE